MTEILKDGIKRLQTKWPQAHIVEHTSGNTLITVPSVVLPDGYDQTICTVLFVSPPGFPACTPKNFWTDIDIDLAIPRVTDGLGDPVWPTKHPQKTSRFTPGDGYFHPIDGKWRNAESRFTLESLWPQWRKAMCWGLHLQAWNPNQSSLFTYMMCIKQRLYWTPKFVERTAFDMWRDSAI